MKIIVQVASSQKADCWLDCVQVYLGDSLTRRPSRPASRFATNARLRRPHRKKAVPHKKTRMSFVDSNRLPSSLLISISSRLSSFVFCFVFSMFLKMFLSLTVHWKNGVIFLHNVMHEFSPSYLKWIASMSRISKYPLNAMPLLGP